MAGCVRPDCEYSVQGRSGRLHIALARKSGAGFYAYGEDATAEEDPGAADGDALVERIVAQLVNEAWFALDAGVAEPDELDVAMTVGLGYPQGPLAWGRELGLARVVALLERLAGPAGDERYRAAPGLRVAAATPSPR